MSTDRLRLVDIDGDDDEQRIVIEANSGERIIPTIFLNDGTVLAEPSNVELAQQLGIKSTPARFIGAGVHFWLTDFRADVPAIDVPSLVVQGEADQVPRPVVDVVRAELARHTGGCGCR